MKHTTNLAPRRLPPMQAGMDAFDLEAEREAGAIRRIRGLAPDRRRQNDINPPTTEVRTRTILDLI